MALVAADVAATAGASDTWENPLQVAARNKMRGRVAGGDTGRNIADLDMGEEEVHQLLADLVSAKS